MLIGRRRHPQLRRGATVEEFARLEHVVVSPRGGGFVTPVDDALAALGHSRNVVLSAASFLFVPEIVSQSDFVALVPERLVRGRAGQLEVVECPFPVKGFPVGMVWHGAVTGIAASAGSGKRSSRWPSHRPAHGRQGPIALLQVRRV